MKRTIISVLALFLTSTAYAGPAGKTVTSGDVKVRVGTSCTLQLYGLSYKGKCDIAKKQGATDSVIQIKGKNNEVFFRIDRDETNKKNGSFYQVKDGKDHFVARVHASGGCWKGDNVQFCAK